MVPRDHDIVGGRYPDREVVWVEDLSPRQRLDGAAPALYVLPLGQDHEVGAVEVVVLDAGRLTALLPLRTAR